MSGNGTDYTLTPNLGLYKPIANMAVGLWGDLWNSNADAIDSAIHASTGGGPYLPLAGNATVFGPTTFSGPTTFTNPLNYTATGGATLRAAQDRAAETISVKDFGAKGDGTTDDTAAIQAAANAIPASGGPLRFSRGVYVVNTAIAVPSNTLVQGYGATLLAKSSGFAANQALITNKNYAATTLTDHDIAVHNMTFDYGSSGMGGGAHAINFSFARNVSVVNCTIQCRGAGDAVAMIGCYNTLVDGCSAYGFINCAYDHWWGPSYGRVVNCYAETATSAQMINWNPEASVGSSTGLVAKGFLLANCTLVATGANAVANQIEPLGAGTFVRDVVIQGNTFVNGFLAIRRAISNAVIANNVFDGSGGGDWVIAAYSADGGSPSNLSITGNLIINPATVIGNIAVMTVQTSNAIIANNAVIGGTVSGLDTGSFTPVVVGNYFSNGLSNTTGSVLQTNQVQVAALQISGGLHFANPSSSPTDLTHGVDLGGGLVGITASSVERFNLLINAGGAFYFLVGGTQVSYVDGSGINAPIGKGVPNAGSFSVLQSPTLSSGASYASDVAAAAGGVPIGQFYRNGSAVMIRVT